jgi:hypothetical protein
MPDRYGGALAGAGRAAIEVRALLKSQINLFSHTMANAEKRGRGQADAEDACASGMARCVRLEARVCVVIGRRRAL